MFHCGRNKYTKTNNVARRLSTTLRDWSGLRIFCYWSYMEVWVLTSFIVTSSFLSSEWTSPYGSSKDLEGGVCRSQPRAESNRVSQEPSERATFKNYNKKVTFEQRWISNHRRWHLSVSQCEQSPHFLVPVHRHGLRRSTLQQEESTCISYLSHRLRCQMSRTQCPFTAHTSCWLEQRFSVKLI